MEVPFDKNKPKAVNARTRANRANNIRRLAKQFPSKSLQALLIKEALREALAREKATGETPAAEIAATAVLQAMEGDDKARAWVTDHHDGPVKQTVSVEISGDALRQSDLAVDLVAKHFQDVEGFDNRFNEWLSEYQVGLKALASMGSQLAPGRGSEPSPTD